MKAKIYSIDGKEKGNMDLPKCFSSKVREDIVAKVIEVKKLKQPYGASVVAGLQASASGKLIHRRHVWKSQYGRGMSRVPRKAFSRRGTQFRWEAATVPNVRGGRRAHPPKPISMMNDVNLKVNKKEMKIALMSAISATANDKKLIEKYERVKNEKMEMLPIIVENKLTTLKTKELVNSLKKILGENLFQVALKEKNIRAGIGKLRGRKYKQNAGALIVVGNKEEIKTKRIDSVKVNALSVTDLAKGGVGRLTIYTEEAVKELGEKLK